MPNIQRISAYIFLLILAVAVNLFAQLKELPLKALFIEASVRFITWPEEQHQSDSSEFIIGYFENDRLVPYLKKAFGTKPVKGNAVSFVFIDSLSMIDSCDMVIIPDLPQESVDEIISATEGKPILTVSDISKHLKKGITLVILVRKNRIVSIVDISRASESKLRISHHLLQKSIIINGDVLDE